MSDPSLPAPPAGPPVPAEPATFRWVPIRSLAERHRPRILKHLLELDERDRYLRFGHVASDAQVGRYVDLLDFERDELFGVFNRRLEIVAMAHLATVDAGAGAGAAEFGVSVNRRARGRGVGARLFDHAVLHARNRGLDTLHIHALSENAAMLHIARRAGATVERHGGEAEAVLRLPPEGLASHLEQWVEEGRAQLDYSLKRQAMRLDDLLDSIAIVTTQVGDSHKAASE